MKAFATIHYIEHFDNRSNVSFNLEADHKEYVNIMNRITNIERKYNAQSNIYQNRKSLIFDKHVNVVGTTYGNCGGTITFHNHSCDPKKAAKELIELLESI